MHFDRTTLTTRREFAAMLASLSLASTGIARAQNSGLTPQGRRAAEKFVAGLVENGAVPGVSYSIGNTDALLAQGAFGLRDLTPAAPMQSATRCALASVSKQFTAAAIFLLAQRGRVSVSALLSNYLPEYVYARDMTLAQLLTMRAGVTASDEACETPIGGRIDDSTLITNLNRHKLAYPPGSYFAYTNCGYDLLSVVIERVSRMSYGRFLAENFFEPLGMRSSYVLGARTDVNFAQGYARENGRWQSAPWNAADRAFGSGNLVSTVSDLQRWDRSLLHATILSRDSLRKMFEVPTIVGRAHMHYASGWFVEPSGAIWHGGTLAGYGTVNFLVPSTGYAVVLLSNGAPSETWKPDQAARDVYNATGVGPPLPPLRPRVRSTVPTP